jgi:hypothetical protein
MKLPQKLPLDRMQTQWASAIEPVLNNPTNMSNLLSNIQLSTGTNVINHKLGRKLRGWIPTRIRAAALIFDDQDSNQHPELTLILVSSAPCVIDLEVF